VDDSAPSPERGEDFRGDRHSHLHSLRLAQCLAAGEGDGAGISHGPRGLNPTVHSAYCREWISKQRQRQLILHADNASAMRAATLQVLLEKIGVLLSLSLLRELKDNNNTPRRSSARPNTDQSTSVGPLLAWMKPANGRLHAWNGTCISIATARSNLGLLNKVRPVAAQWM
jgi:ParB-like chromosome segregation protein Spo0J